MKDYAAPQPRHPSAGVRRWAVTCAVALMATSGLALTAAPVAADHKQNTPPSNTVDTNPDLVGACGINLNLILDRSGSIGSNNGKVKAAAQALVDGLEGTGSRVRVISFSDTASVLSGTESFADPATISIPTFTSAGATNWDDGLELGRVSTGGIPKLTVMITDGDPTVRNRDQPNGHLSGVEGDSSNTSPGDLTAAVEEANLLKAGGSHLFVIGVGNALSNNGSQDRIEAISGPHPYTTATLPADFGKTDYTLVQNFDLLTTTLRAFVRQLCGSSLNITKWIQPANGGAASKATEPFTFDVGTSSSVTWTQPATGAGSAATLATDRSGAANFKWRAPSTSVTVTEQAPPAGFTFNGARCSRSNLDGTAPTLLFDTVGANAPGTSVASRTIAAMTATNDEALNCDVYNREIRKGKISVTKVTEPANSPGTFSFTLSGTTAVETVTGLGHGATASFAPVPRGTYSVSEAAAPGYTPAGSTCDDRKTQAVETAVPTAVVVAEDSDWLCTFRNTVIPVLSGSVVKLVDADRDRDFSDDEAVDLAPSQGAPVDVKVTITNTSGVTVNLGALTDTIPDGAGVTDLPVACEDAQGAAVTPPLTLGATPFVCYFTLTNYAPAAGPGLVNTFTAPMTREGSAGIAPSDTATTTTGRADLALVKTSSGAALTGTAGSYFIDVKNVGTGDAAGPFTVTDTLPAGVVATAVSGGTDWTCQPIGAGSSISCTHAGLLAPDASAPRITVSVNWVTAGDKDNRATVSQVTGETFLENNTEGDLTPVTVSPTPDLTLTKTAPATRTTGDTGNYSLLVENVGTAAATADITVTDTLPSGVTVAPGNNSGFSCTVVANVVTCITTEDIAVGASKTLVLPATFTSSGIKSNTATVTVSGDGNPANNTSTASTSVVDPQGPPPPPPPPPALLADLAVKKTGPASVSPGGTATWALTVTNKGPGNAAGFSVTDTLPSGVSLTSITGTDFTCTAATAVCTFTKVLLPGQTAVVNVVGAVSPTVAGSSVANVVVVGPADATPGDNTDTLVSVIDRPTPPPPAPGQADLVLNKTAPAAEVVPGDPITWTITVTNAGTADATGFTVSDPLAPGLALVQAAGQGFSCAGATVQCAFAGPLAPGQVATLVVTAALAEDYTSSSVANTATAALQGDPTPANNSDTATSAVKQPIGGVDEEPATGEEPTPPPTTAPTQGAEEEPAAAPATPRSLPFSGSSTDQLLALAAGLSLAGLVLALAGRRRRTAE